MHSTYLKQFSTKPEVPTEIETMDWCLVGITNISDSLNNDQMISLNIWSNTFLKMKKQYYLILKMQFVSI